MKTKKLKRTYAVIRYKVKGVWFTLEIDGEIEEYLVETKRYKIEEEVTE